MVLAMWVLQLGAVEAEVKGAAGPPVAVTEEQREALRFHGATHFVVNGAFSGFALAGGPGSSAELGATFVDRFARYSLW